MKLARLMVGLTVTGRGRLHTRLGRGRTRFGAPALALCGSLGLCALSARVAAQDPGGNGPLAQGLFEEARALVAAGKVAEACPKLAESQRLDPAIGTLFYLAECLERSGKSASAWTRYLEVADIAAKAGQPAKERFARARAERLSPGLHRLALTVPDAVRALPGIRIEVDGSPLAEAEWDAAIAVDPGEHQVRVAAGGKKPWSVTRTAEIAGQTVVIEIPVLQDEATPVPPAPVHDSAATPGTISIPFTSIASTTGGAPRSAAPETRVVGASLLGGLGAAGLIAGGILGGLALGEKGSLSAHCQGAGPGVTDCTAPGIAAANRARDLANGSTVGFVAGALLIGAGAVIYVVARPTPPPRTPAASPRSATPAGVSLRGAALTAGDDGVVLAVRGTWE